MISSIKRQFAELLSDIGFIKTKLTSREMERAGGRKSDGVIEALEAENLNQRHDDEYIMKALLVAALYPNVVKVETISDKATLMIRGDEDICIHPTSIHRKTKRFPFRFLLFLEKVKTTRVYLRDATNVDGLALALFGGQLTQVSKCSFLQDRKEIRCLWTMGGSNLLQIQKYLPFSNQFVSRSMKSWLPKSLIHRWI